jgi:starch phosphorylase
VKVQTTAAQHIFDAEVYLHGLDPKVVRVELYADGIHGSDPIRQEMTRLRPSTGQPGEEIYRAAVSAARLATDYTARIIPHYDGVTVPLEMESILWQR